MGILTGMKIDYDKSKVFKETFYEGENILGQCYSIVLNVVESCKENGIEIEGLEIAYGYVGNPNVKMFRHCFFLLGKEKILDPTLVMEIKEDDEYHIFKILSFQEYYKLKNKFYNEYSKEVDAPTLEALLQNEEKEYCDYVIKNNICIDSYSYEEFLKIYDLENKVISIL